MAIPLPDDVRAAFAAGQKIEAIRLLREHTGMGLAEAKAAVETDAMPDPPDHDIHDHGLALPAAAVAALAEGNMVAAIRAVRMARGVGLKEAKDIVDAARRGTTWSEPDERRRSPKGIWVALALLAALIIVVWRLLAGPK